MDYRQKNIPGSSTERVACPPVKIKNAEWIEAIEEWIKAGKTKEERKRRRKVVSKNKRKIIQALNDLRNGRFIILKPHLALIPKENGDKRLIAIFPMAVAIAIKACMIKLRKHPELSRMFPGSYAYVGEGGAIRSTKDLLRAVARIADEEGSATIVALDIVSFFRSLSPARAIERARACGMNSSICDMLDGVYKLINDQPEFSGLQEGPASSPLISEFGMQPFDRRMIKETDFCARYSDNIVFVLAGEREEENAKAVVIKALQEHNTEEGTNLEAHDWQYTRYTYDQGFTDRLAWMGFEFQGFDARPKRSKIERAKKAIKKALAGNDLKKVQDTIEGGIGYYGQIVATATLDSCVQELLETLGQWCTQNPYSHKALATLGHRNPGIQESLVTPGHGDTPPSNRSVITTPSPFCPLGDNILSRHRPRGSKRLGGLGSKYKNGPHCEVRKPREIINHRDARNNKDRRSVQSIGRSSGPPLNSRMPFNDGRGCKHSLLCEKKLTDDKGRVVHKPRDLLLYARDVCEACFATDSRSGKERLEVVLDAPDGMQRTFEVIDQNYFRQRCDEPPEPGSPGYCGHGLYIERGGSELLFGLCPEHARQVARAYLFVDFYLENCNPALLSDLPDEKCFYTIGTITGSTWWIPWVVAVLIRGRCLRLYGSKKFDRAITRLREIQDDHNRQFDKRTNELIAALDHDVRKELVKVADRLSNFARSL